MKWLEKSEVKVRLRSTWQSFSWTNFFDTLLHSGIEIVATVLSYLYLLLVPLWSFENHLLMLKQVCAVQPWSCKYLILASIILCILPSVLCAPGSGTGCLYRSRTKLFIIIINIKLISFSYSFSSWICSQRKHTTSCGEGLLCSRSGKHAILKYSIFSSSNVYHYYLCLFQAHRGVQILINHDMLFSFSNSMLC